MSNAFQLTILDGGVALLTFDLPDAKVNTFSAAVMGELAGIVAQLEKRSDIRGLLLRSGKPGQFIAGADIKELGALAYATKEDAARTLAFGHDLFSQIENLPFPTVALVDGACMGGGTELILSMDQRIASSSPKTRIALPEVKIGLIPGWGGTQRMPRVAGLSAALEWITSGEPAEPKSALENGLVYDAVPTEKLVEEGQRLIESMQATGEWKAIRKRKSAPMPITPDQLNFAFAAAEGMVLKATKGQYPAPIIALKAMKLGITKPLAEGLKIEREVAMEVFGSTIAANLIANFFNNSRLARDSGVSDRSVKPREIKSAGVLGAGVMGAGIAAAFARGGTRTTMVDLDDARINAGLKSAASVIESRIQIGKAKPEELAAMMAALNTSTSTRSFEGCDVVVEAITENEELKKKVYAGFIGSLGKETILASNTSTISITRLAAASGRPERFAGMHFFNPVDRMPLVEVIRGEKTSDETIVTLVALAKALRKTPIVVNDCPGFLVNRVLLPYMAEALLLLTEGATMDQIDKVATKWGMPMGPIALYDLVGLDVGLFAGQVLIAGYKDRAVDVPMLKSFVDAGRLGKKTGKGFYAYDAKGRPQPDPSVSSLIGKSEIGNRKSEITDSQIEDRLFLVLLLEAIRAWEDRIVRDPGDVDMGMILGTGFPAFRGGPLRWCDTEGAATILKRVEPYAKLGKRFDPPKMLTEMAKNGETYYPQPKAIAKL